MITRDEKHCFIVLYWGKKGYYTTRKKYIFMPLTNEVAFEGLPGASKFMFGSDGSLIIYKPKGNDYSIYPRELTGEIFLPHDEMVKQLREELMQLSIDVEVLGG